MLQGESILKARLFKYFLPRLTSTEALKQVYNLEYT